MLATPQRSCNQIFRDLLYWWLQWVHIPTHHPTFTSCPTAPQQRIVKAPGHSLQPEPFRPQFPADQAPPRFLISGDLDLRLGAWDRGACCLSSGTAAPLESNLPECPFSIAIRSPILQSAFRVTGACPGPPEAFAVCVCAAVEGRVQCSANGSFPCEGFQLAHRLGERHNVATTAPPHYFMKPTNWVILSDSHAKAQATWGSQTGCSSSACYCPNGQCR